MQSRLLPKVPGDSWFEPSALGDRYLRLNSNEGFPRAVGGAGAIGEDAVDTGRVAILVNDPRPMALASSRRPRSLPRPAHG